MAKMRKRRASGAMISLGASGFGLGALAAMQALEASPLAFVGPARLPPNQLQESVERRGMPKVPLSWQWTSQRSVAAVAVVPLAATLTLVFGLANKAKARASRVARRQGPKQGEKAMLSDMKGPVNLQDVEGLPWWWEAVWKLPFTKRGQRGEPLCLGDTMHVFRTNIEQIFGGEPSYDGAPLATGDLASAGLTDGTMYMGLKKYWEDFGPVYKLCFGPKSFMVVSDPQMMRHILRENVFNYDKGVLGEVLEDVMGKGLIPADFETWKVRRRAIVPGFHKAWLNFQLSEFGKAGELLVSKLRIAAEEGKTVDMEERFGSVALDIIGKSIFNYEFESIEKESLVVKAAIQSLREVEHRAQTPFQYWKIPLADVVIERQREFKDNMELLNGALNKCISQALSDRSEADLEELENRDYTKMENPSLLRFLVDMKGEETSGKQLRDDMITMLIAGHETTASALTWALFELAQNPELMARVQKEVDEVLTGKRYPNYDDVKQMELARLCFAESLRMYPEPPLLIRRALDEDTLPAGAAGTEVKVLRGMDFFVSIYNLHRDERYWPNPNTFDPDRFKRKYSNPDIPGWAGYNPDKWKGQLYPTETAADYALIPFGAGPRKCPGDEFAMLEGTVTLAMMIRYFDFSFAAPTADPSQVGTNTGATIHTKNGLWMKPRLREH